MVFGNKRGLTCWMDSESVSESVRKPVTLNPNKHSTTLTGPLWRRLKVSDSEAALEASGGGAWVRVCVRASDSVCLEGLSCRSCKDGRKRTDPLRLVVAWRQKLTSLLLLLWKGIKPPAQRFPPLVCFCGGRTIEAAWVTRFTCSSFIDPFSGVSARDTDVSITSQTHHRQLEKFPTTIKSINNHIRNTKKYRNAKKWQI